MSLLQESWSFWDLWVYLHKPTLWGCMEYLYSTMVFIPKSCLPMQHCKSTILKLKKKKINGIPIVTQRVEDPMLSLRMQVQSLALLSGLSIRCCMSCGVGWRCGSDPVLLWLWLWCRLAAVDLIWPLAWELPYAAGAAVKRKISPSLHFWIQGLVSHLLLQ